MLGYRIDLNFNGNKFAIKVDDDEHSDRNTDYEIKRPKTVEQDHSSKFIRIYPGKEDLDVYKAINEIFRHIKQFANQLNKQSTKKP